MLHLVYEIIQANGAIFRSLLKHALEKFWLTELQSLIEYNTILVLLGNINDFMLYVFSEFEHCYMHNKYFVYISDNIYP